jgi:hypothetical protein
MLHADMRALKSCAAAVELRGFSLKRRGLYINPRAHRQSFLPRGNYRRIEQCFRGVYTANILGQMPSVE